ncbi:formin-like protein 5 [Ornithorhynchus anatinus]|uniref:formin-like protein 5 n=1 Tax=Ornithorhynchus anatinus TaxID=9258 RepID=UPI0010A8D0F4|nr:formin-like protein 5 [Ornithorhynchus anatinus]
MSRPDLTTPEEPDVPISNRKEIPADRGDQTQRPKRSHGALGSVPRAPAPTGFLVLLPGSHRLAQELGDNEPYVFLTLCLPRRRPGHTPDTPNHGGVCVEPAMPRSPSRSPALSHQPRVLPTATRRQPLRFTGITSGPVPVQQRKGYMTARSAPSKGRSKLGATPTTEMHQAAPVALRVTLGLAPPPLPPRAAVGAEAEYLGPGGPRDGRREAGSVGVEAPARDPAAPPPGAARFSPMEGRGGLGRRNPPDPARPDPTRPDPTDRRSERRPVLRPKGPRAPTPHTAPAHNTPPPPPPGRSAGSLAPPAGRAAALTL